MSISTVEGAAHSRRPLPSTKLAKLDVANVSGGVFAAVAVAACGLAFLGLAVSNWWTDELFTLYLVDHEGGFGEVLRRALTDTHPPAYYFVLYGWKSVFGASETALRSLSALCAVGAAAVFVRATWRTFSPAAIAFAVAVGVTGPFWFYQAQNVRNYPFCLLLGALMLGCALRLRRETLEGRAAWLTFVGLALAGTVNAFSHFYGLLTTGFVFGWLLLTLRDWRLRAALVAAGLAILAAIGLYIRALSGHTQQNMGELWFRNDPDHLLGVIREVIRSGVASNVQYGMLLMLLVVLVALLVRRGPPEAIAPAIRQALAADGRLATRRWLAGFGGVVIGGVYLTGVVVSLVFTPSLSDQNVLIASPFLWLLWAALYDRTDGLLGPRSRPWVAALLASLLAAQLVTHAQGRLLPRNEQWRDSADYIAGLPACAGAEIPVVRPFKFGPDTAFFRELSVGGFFGRFFPRERLVLRNPPAFVTPGADPAFAAKMARRANDPSACPVLAWAVHDLDLGDAQAMREALQRMPGIAPAAVQLRGFSHYRRDGLGWRPRPSGYVFLAVRPGKEQP